MKRTGRIWLVLILSLIAAVPVFADVQGGRTEPDYKTDYYMIVESKAGGIDIYAQPDLSSSKLNEELIPNGTALHIEGEVEDEQNKRTWGYTEYHGMYGYAPLDDCRPAQSRQEAIDSELYIAGKENVDYDADYDVTAYSEDGRQNLYQGPGEKYGAVPGAREIENGETLHITRDARLVDGSLWGVTSVDGKEGWVDLKETEEWLEEQNEETSVKAVCENTTEAGDNADQPDEKASGENSPMEPEKAAAVTPEATVMPETTVTPEATVTPEVTAAPKVTATPEATATPKVTATPEVTAAPEAAKSDEAAEDVSSQEVKADADTFHYQPLVWIGMIGIAAVILLLIYHFKKS